MRVSIGIIEKRAKVCIVTQMVTNMKVIEWIVNINDLAVYLVCIHSFSAGIVRGGGVLYKAIFFGYDRQAYSLTHRSPVILPCVLSVICRKFQR
jgi:hypothetical protein